MSTMQPCPSLRRVAGWDAPDAGRHHGTRRSHGRLCPAGELSNDRFDLMALDGLETHYIMKTHHH